MNSINPVFLMAAPSLLIAIGCLVYLFGNESARSAVATGWKSSATCAVVPGLIFLLLFYSLALHMHNSLGAWPERIGNHGFSPALNMHAEIALNYFSWFFLFAIFAWPILVGLFAVFTGARRYLPQIIGPGVSFWLFAPLIFLAPSGFLYWWWD
jgi:hypothetical protein